MVTPCESNQDLLTPPDNQADTSTQNERVLHKMISNTLKHYEIEGTYSADDVVRILRRNKLLTYTEAATQNGSVKSLNSIIDLGSKPLQTILGNADGGKVGDRPEPGDKPQKKKKKRKGFSDLMFLPPRPSDNLEVITYAECQPKLFIRKDQFADQKLDEYDITRLHIESTIEDANAILKPLRGRVAIYDRLILLYLVFGMVFTAVVGLLLGFFLHYAASIALGLLYFLVLGGFVLWSKRRTGSLI